MKTKFNSLMIVVVLMSAFFTLNSCKKDPDPVPEPQQVAAGGMCLYGHFDGNDCVLPTTNCLCEIVVVVPAPTQFAKLNAASTGDSASIPLIQDFFVSGDYKSIFPKLDSTDGGRILLGKFKQGFYAMSKRQSSTGAENFYLAGSPLQLSNNEAEWVFPVKN